ncbi:hypothetical protein AVEN_210522-1 [Araneus ventricosus]|uniref:HTH psq-type domain-containing protein n=1 Tax=Araneus ventricosus TaxID=182803 RepID=A0A4Y2FCV1_ARAVE|nr:hypothetical protein AVEN_210522-1 [Araneus ventricosus]
MPRTYQGKTNRQSWSQENMEGEVLSGRMVLCPPNCKMKLSWLLGTEEQGGVLSGRMGYMLSAKSFHVSQSTLENRVIKARAYQLTCEKAAIKGGMSSIILVFSEQQEKDYQSIYCC